MWTSGGGSTYSSSRLSSLWLLVHSDTLPCLCKTVLFLQPPKGVQQWLNTPKWPYQLFYYFSCEGGGGGSTLSAQKLSKNSIHLCYPAIKQNPQTHFCLKESEQGMLWSCCSSYLIWRSFFKFIHFFCSLLFKAGKHHLYWMNHYSVFIVMTEVCAHGMNLSDWELVIITLVRYNLYMMNKLKIKSLKINS